MKLLFFDVPARAEMTRLALRAGGVPFEDCRVAIADWPAVKPTTPRGHLPTLTLPDGYVLTESVAILRYAGAVGSPRLYPADAAAAARVDEAVDVIAAITTATAGVYGKPDAEAASIMKEHVAPGGTIAAALQWANASAAAAGSGHLVGATLTIADCAMKPAMDYLETIAGGAIAGHLVAYPALVTTVAVTSAVPAIAAYEAEHKK